MKIAIIDSGLTPAFLPKNNRIFYQGNISPNGDINSNTTDFSGHGTSIVNILDDACSDDDFLIIKILDQRNTAKEKQLKKALEIALEMKADVVNLSLGIEKKSMDPELLELLELFNYNKSFIVTTTTSTNVNNPLYKNSNVVKVLGLSGISRYAQIYYDGVFYRNNLPQLRKWIGEKFKIIGGNSFCVPYIVAQIDTCLKANMRKNEVLQNLMHTSNSINPPDFGRLSQVHIEKETISDMDTYRTVLKLIEIFLTEPLVSTELFTNGISNKNITRFIDYLNRNLFVQLNEKNIEFEDLCFVENLSNKIFKLKGQG